MSTGTPLTWPSRCDMPELPGLSAATSIDYALNRIFVGRGPKDAKAHALVMNYIRVADILVIDYSSARKYLIETVKQDGSVRFHQLLLATSHFENCITTALRTIHFGCALRDEYDFGIAKQNLSALEDTVEKAARRMRNAIEHLDDRIAKNQWKPGEPHALIVKEDRVELLGEVILYADLAAWVTDLHKLAVELSQFKEP